MFGESPIRAAIRAKLYSQPAWVSPSATIQNPSYTIEDPGFAPVISTVAVPTIQQLRNDSIWRNPSKRFRERQKSGEIVINPMMRTSLELLDHLEPLSGTPGSNVSVTHYGVGISILRPKGYFPWAPNFEVSEYNGRYFDPHLILNGTHALVCTYRRQNDASALVSASKAVGLGLPELKSYHLIAVNQLRARPDSVGLFTKVVAETRSGSFDVLTNLGEARATIGTVMSNVLRVLRAYIDAKRLIARKGPFMKSEEILGFWLEVRYGLMPIVYSIDDAMTWLRDRDHEYFEFRGLEMSPIQDYVSGSTKFSFNGAQATDRAYGKSQVSSSAAGLKFNPLATAWELVTLSFVIDWVLNIGDYLSALIPPTGAVQEKYSYSRSVKDLSITLTVNGRAFPGVLGFYEMRLKDPLTDIGVTTEFSMSWKRWVDAFALSFSPLRQHIRGNRFV